MWIMNLNFQNCDSNDLVGVLTQTNGCPKVQLKIIRIFAANENKRKEICSETWLYVYSVLTKRLKPKVRPFLEERNLAIPRIAA